MKILALMTLQAAKKKVHTCFNLVGPVQQNNHGGGGVRCESGMVDESHFSGHDLYTSV